MKNIELITWIDSFGCSSSWSEITNDPISLQYCYSAGFILKEDENYIVIASHYHESNENNGAIESACGEMTIPKKCITSRKILINKYGEA